jgi:hypothetical protein
VRKTGMRYPWINMESGTTLIDMDKANHKGVG